MNYVKMSVHLHGHLSVGAYILLGFYPTSTSLFFALHCLNVSVYPCVCWSVCLSVFLLPMAIDLHLVCDGAKTTQGGQTDGRTDIGTDRPTDGLLDGPKDRQTDGLVLL